MCVYTGGPRSPRPPSYFLCTPRYTVHSVHVMMLGVSKQVKGDFYDSRYLTAQTDGNLKRGIVPHCLAISVVRSNGHVAEDNIVQKIERRKPMCKRPIGRPKTRW